MSARRCRTEETSSAATPKLVRPPEFDTRNFYAQAVNLAFDQKRILLRRTFFIEEYRTKYVSVGFYPTRDYQPHVEFGAVNKRFYHPNIR